MLENRKKWILSAAAALLLLAIACSMFFLSQKDDPASDHIIISAERINKPSNVICTFTTYRDHVTIAGYSSSLPQNAILPKKYNEKVVTEIGQYAFLDCDECVTVYIPESILSVGKGAFQGCDNLKMITAFRDCKIDPTAVPENCTIQYY